MHRDPVQSRVAAARPRVRDAQDHRGRGAHRARPAGRARPRQPRRGATGASRRSTSRRCGGCCSRTSRTTTSIATGEHHTSRELLRARVRARRPRLPRARATDPRSCARRGRHAPAPIRPRRASSSAGEPRTTLPRAGRADGRRGARARAQARRRRTTLRVLVTGGAGAIGSHVVDALLARGDEVAVLDSFHPFYPRAHKERNLARARGHAASPASTRATCATPRSWPRPSRASRRGGGPPGGARGRAPEPRGPGRLRRREPARHRGVLNAARRGGVERFVFASSSSVYGERPRGPFTRGPRGGSAALAVRRDQARRRAAVPRGAPHGGLRRHLSALLHRLRPAPAPRPGDPQVRAARARGKTDPGLRRRQRRARLHLRRATSSTGWCARSTAARGYAIYNLGRGQPVTLDATIDALEAALRNPRRARRPARAAGRRAAHLGVDRPRARRARLRSARRAERGHRARSSRWLREEDA